MVTATRRIKCGEVVDIPDQEARALIEKKLAVEAGAKEPVKAEKAVAPVDPKAEKATADKAHKNK